MKTNAVRGSAWFVKVRRRAKAFAEFVGLCVVALGVFAGAGVLWVAACAVSLAIPVLFIAGLVAAVVFPVLGLLRVFGVL